MEILETLELGVQGVALVDELEHLFLRPCDLGGGSARVAPQLVVLEASEVELKGRLTIASLELLSSRCLNA